MRGDLVASKELLAQNPLSAIGSMRVTLRRRSLQVITDQSKNELSGSASMITNFDRLRNTVRYVEKLWQVERRCQEKNAVHEGAWSIQVIEPVLAALEWPRLRRDCRESTGAYFEWPEKHNVDVALLEEGSPRAYIELKMGPGWSPAKRHKDLLCKLNRYPDLGDARFGVASWFVRDAGYFEVYEVGPSSTLKPNPVLTTFADACEDPSPLARLAAPVLSCQVVDSNAWLNATTADGGLFVPRCSTRNVQQKFFKLLAGKLGLGGPLQSRYRCLDCDPPSPSYAYVDLPGVLPVGWGLVLDIDTTMNQLQAFFYRNSNTKIGKTGKWSFDDDGDLSDEALESFLVQQVLPIIERRRLEAVAAGVGVDGASR